jgi:HD-like signal output (HDOD) protein
MTNQSSSKVDYWVKQLADVELPVLSGVMQELNIVTQNDDSCAAQLSEIILKDSALTTKVLRIANSVHYNPGIDNQVMTISRAVIKLGFHSIKAISLSVMLIDSLLKQSSRERMLQWMAKSFHCAVQAETLLKATTGNDREESVFISGLLLHLGEMAFWSGNSKLSHQMEPLLGDNTVSNQQVEIELLGCTLNNISCALVHKWDLGEQLGQALAGADIPFEKLPDAIKATRIAAEISQATEQGWDSLEFQSVVTKASLFSGLSKDETRLLIEQAADKAASVALTYGANKICHLIPSKHNAVQKNIDPEATSLKADPKLQLSILREMATMVKQRVEINTLFQMVVEGIHRGIGLERVCLCLADPSMSTLAAKYVLGVDTDQWRHEMQLPVKAEQNNLFAYCLHTRTSMWLREGVVCEQQHLIDKHISHLIDTQNCLISVVYSNNRSIGIIVADKGIRNRVAIDQDQRDSFEHFSQQVNMSLAVLAEMARNAKK